MRLLNAVTWRARVRRLSCVMPVQESLAHAEQAALRSPTPAPVMSANPDTEGQRVRLSTGYPLDAVLDWNLPDRTAHFSPRLSEILGYAQGELDVSQSGWREHVHPDDRGEVRERLRAHLHGEVAHYEAEFRV